MPTTASESSTTSIRVIIIPPNDSAPYMFSTKRIFLDELLDLVADSPSWSETLWNHCATIFLPQNDNNTSLLGHYLLIQSKGQETSLNTHTSNEQFPWYDALVLVKLKPRITDYEDIAGTLLESRHWDGLLEELKGMSEDVGTPFEIREENSGSGHEVGNWKGKVDGFWRRRKGYLKLD